MFARPGGDTRITAHSQSIVFRSLMESLIGTASRGCQLGVETYHSDCALIVVLLKQNNEHKSSDACERLVSSVGKSRWSSSRMLIDLGSSRNGTRASGVCGHIRMRCSKRNREKERKSKCLCTQRCIHLATFSFFSRLLHLLISFSLPLSSVDQSVGVLNEWTTTMMMYTH